MKRFLNSKILIILTLITLVLYLSNDFTLIDIKETAIIVELGIDKDGENYEVSAQIAVPKAGEQAAGSAAVLTGRGETLGLAIEDIGTRTGWYPNLSFCNVIILGSEVIGEGVMNSVDYFVRNVRLQDTAQLCAAEGKAGDVLRAASPLDDFSALSLYKILEADARSSSNVSIASLREFAMGYYSASGFSLMPLVKMVNTQGGADDESGQGEQSQDGQGQAAFYGTNERNGVDGGCRVCGVDNACVCGDCGGRSACEKVQECGVNVRNRPLIENSASRATGGPQAENTAFVPLAAETRKRRNAGSLPCAADDSQGGSQGEDQGKEAGKLYDATSTLLFENGKPVGVMDGEHTVVYNLIKHKNGVTYVEISGSEYMGKKADVFLSLNDNCGKMSLKMENGRPTLYIGLKVFAKIEDTTVTVPPGKPASSYVVPDNVLRDAETYLARIVYEIFEDNRARGCDVFEVKDRLYRTCNRYYEAYKDIILQNTAVRVSVTAESYS